MKQVTITAEPISTARALEPLEHLGGGAIASFTGIARADSGVVALELEHYPGMTEKNLNALADEAMARWPAIQAFLGQDVAEASDVDASRAALATLLTGGAAAHPEP